MLFLILVLSGVSVAQRKPPGLDFWRLQQQIATKLQTHEYEPALKLLKELNELLPNCPRTLFRIAIAEGFLNRETDLYHHIDSLIRMKVYYDLSTEPAFIRFRQTPTFKRLILEMSKIKNGSQYKASVAFRIPDRNFIPEGIAFDSHTNSFFVASIRERKIIQIRSDGSVSDFITSRQNDIWSISGIGIDTKRRLLWACSTAFEGAEGYSPDKKEVAVYAFSLKNGNLAGTYPLQQPGENHFCDGLTVARDGTVFVADPSALVVYRLDPDSHQLNILIPPEAGISPQGLAISEQDARLFISDYVQGIYLLDLKSGQIASVASRSSQSLAGIDGLNAIGSDLIAIQNGIEPSRVVRLHMSSDGTTVKSIETLEINHPLFGEPTLGVIKDDSLFFIANNAVGKYLKDRDVASLPEPIVLSRRLSAPRARKNLKEQ